MSDAASSSAAKAAAGEVKKGYDRSRTTLLHRVQWVTLRVVGRVVAALPMEVAIGLGALLGRTAATLFPIRRRVVRENLRIAFGDSLDEREHRRLLREAYRSLGMMGLESFLIRWRDPKWVEDRVVEHVGLEHVEALRASGEQFVAVTGHFGNWELLGSYLAHHYPVTTLSKPMHNPLVQGEVAEARARHGIDVLWTDERNLWRRLLETIRSGRHVAFLPDQDARVQGVFVPFFGREASTWADPATLALRQGCALLPVYLVRLGLTRHRLVVHPPIRVEEVRAAAEDVNAQVEELTRRHTAVLEDMVRLYPAQYFWFHRRWKTTRRAAEKKLRHRRELARQAKQG